MLRNTRIYSLLAIRTASTARQLPNVVLIDAVRTPFAISSTVYKDLLAVDLQRGAFASMRNFLFFIGQQFDSRIGRANRCSI